MDPFSAEGELLNIHNAFHSGQYQNVIDFDTSALSSENQLPARVLKLRAQIALGQTDEVFAAVSSDEDNPDLAATKALAQQTAGKADAALQLSQDLAENYPDNATVQVLAGTVLQAQEYSEEALALLSRHQGNLEAVALIVQIHLQQNRTDLALKEVQAAKRWAQDSLLVNLAESWVGMRVGGDKYQSAFYVYEELASSLSTSAALSIVGQAVAEIHLGRLPEAEAALNAALEKYPGDAELIANSIVLNVLAGKPSADLEARLSQTQPSHSLLADIQEKSTFFDTAAAKYSPKVSS
ncbi:coatomer epsilon subunit-domain-containing protein [Penicillium macrosclerotiorum]|uniref:coatomer epsilon subunit-domain-containing protein n=1 Tax=Penicillium macrosclerotiorum TaxID=303699 RepID=UPI002546FB89|nr:coatomer epsilon subunit-domain-containing protein [Penicillium macrosclerotiorum]KAJ5682500.1 coatomer epsilon subunit-domain-containing protein [Penicillium macrosclerotiorum]